MIRRIENLTALVPATGIWITFATPVDPQKVVVMLWGEGMNHETGLLSGNFYAYGWNIPPIWQSLNSSSMQIIPCMTPEFAFDIAVQIIEYI